MATKAMLRGVPGLNGNGAGYSADAAIPDASELSITRRLIPPICLPVDHNVCALDRFVPKRSPPQTNSARLRASALFMDAGLLLCAAVPFPRRSTRGGNGCFDCGGGGEQTRTRAITAGTATVFGMQSGRVTAIAKNEHIHSSEHPRARG
jgi:hypothetical protein